LGNTREDWGEDCFEDWGRLEARKTWLKDWVERLGGRLGQDWVGSGVEGLCVWVGVVVGLGAFV
jgi:hypothetical protein